MGKNILNNKNTANINKTQKNLLKLAKTKLIYFSVISFKNNFKNFINKITTISITHYIMSYLYKIQINFKRIFIIGFIVFIIFWCVLHFFYFRSIFYNNSPALENIFFYFVDLTHNLSFKYLVDLNSYTEQFNNLDLLINNEKFNLIPELKHFNLIYYKKEYEQDEYFLMMGCNQGWRWGRVDPKKLLNAKNYKLIHIWTWKDVLITGAYWRQLEKDLDGTTWLEEMEDIIQNRLEHGALSWEEAKLWRIKYTKIIKDYVRACDAYTRAGLYWMMEEKVGRPFSEKIKDLRTVESERYWARYRRNQEILTWNRFIKITQTIARLFITMYNKKHFLYNIQEIQATILKNGKKR